MDLLDSELNLLEMIHASAGTARKLTQRDMAKSTGLSLGMINSLIKRYAEQGFLDITHHSAKSVSYALSPAGVSKMGRLAAGSLERSNQGAQGFRTKLEAFVARIKDQGATTLVVTGQGEFLFALERICEDVGVVLVRSADPERARSLGKRPGVVLLTADAGKGEEGATSLASILAGERMTVP